MTSPFSTNINGDPIPPIDVVVRTEPIFTMERFVQVMVNNYFRTALGAKALRKLAPMCGLSLSRKDAWKFSSGLRTLALVCNADIPATINPAHQKMINENTQAFVNKMERLPAQAHAVREAVLEKLAELRTRKL